MMDMRVFPAVITTQPAVSVQVSAVAVTTLPAPVLQASAAVIVEQSLVNLTGEPVACLRIIDLWQG